MARPPGEESTAIHAFLCVLPKGIGACTAYVARELQIERGRVQDSLDRLVAAGHVIVMPETLKVPGVNKPLRLYAAAPVEEPAGPGMIAMLTRGLVKA